MDWRPTRCDCKDGPILLDGIFQGLIRTVCPACKRRVWLLGDGRDVRLVYNDRRPSRVTTE